MYLVHGLLEKIAMYRLKNQGPGIIKELPILFHVPNTNAGKDDIPEFTTSVIAELFER